MAQSHKTSYGFLAPRQNLEKTNNTLPRKCQGRQKGWSKDSRMNRSYFIGPFWLLPGAQKYKQWAKNILETTMQHQK